MKKLLLLTSFTILAIVGKAQYTITVATESAFSGNTYITSLFACSKYKLVYAITNNQSGGINDTLTIKLPDGLTYFSYYSDSSNYDVTSVAYTSHLSTPGNPRFIMTGWHNTCYITIYVSTPICSALDNSTDTTKIVGDKSNLYNLVSDPLTIVSPVLEVTDSTWLNPFVLNTGEVGEFVFKVQNNGDVGSKISKVYFKALPDANIKYWPIGNPVYYLTSFDSVVKRGYWNPYTYKLLSPRHTLVRPLHGTNEIDSLTIDTLMGFARSYLPASADSFIFVHIPFKVINCHENPGSVTFYTLCGYDSAAKCSEVSMTTDVEVNSGCPKLSATVNIFDSAAFCPRVNKDTAEVGFHFVDSAQCNSGPPGFARMDSLRLYLYCNSTVASLDTTSFKINGVHIPHSCYTIYSSMGDTVYLIDLTKYHVGATPYPFGHHTISDMDGDGLADELSEDSSFNITATIKYENSTCPPFGQCGITTWYLPAVAATYNDQCNSLPYKDGLLPIDSLTPNAYYRYYASNGTCADSCPADLTSDTFDLKVCTGNFTQTFTPTGFKFDCPHGYYQLSLPLPVGYHINVTSPLLHYYSTPPVRDSSSRIYKYTAKLLDSSWCYGGDTFHIHPLFSEHKYLDSTRDTLFVNFGKLPFHSCGNYNETNILSCFTIPITVNCSQIPASSRYSNNPDNLTFSLQYVCDSGCSGCADNIACNSTSISRHCSGGCASTPFTTSGWSFLRTNLGYINKDLPKYYTAFCSTSPDTVITKKDTLKNKLVVNLEAAYPGDQVEAKVNGGYTAFAPASYRGEYLQIRYDASTFSRPPYYMFELDPDTTSYFVLTNSTISALNGVHLNLPTLPASVTDVTMRDTTAMSFSLDTAIYNYSHTLYSAWKADGTGDSVHVFADIHLRVLNDSSECLTYPVFISCGKNTMSLRTEFMCAKPGGVSADTFHSCDSWGNPFTLLQSCPGATLLINRPSDCDSFPVGVLFEAPGALREVADDFPNEFRPFTELDSTITITLPAGYVYSSTSFYAYIDSFKNNPSTNYFYGGSIRTYFYAKPFYNSNPSNNVNRATILKYKGLNNSCWPLFDQKLPNYAEEPGYYMTIWTKPACSVGNPDTFLLNAGYTVGTQQSDPAFQLKTPVYTYSTVVGHNSPTVEIDNPSPLEDYGNVITYKFTMCNSSLYHVYDGWVAFENIDGYLLDIKHATLTLLDPHTSYTGSLYKNAGDSGVIFNVGALNVLAPCDTFIFSALIDSNSRSCPPPVGGDTGEIVVRCGNICRGTLINPDSSHCQDMVDTFHYHVYPTLLELPNDGYRPLTAVSLCGGLLTDSLTINSADLGTIANPTFWVTLPQGVTLDSITFMYPCPGGNDTTLYNHDTVTLATGGAVASVGWILDKVLKIHGLRGHGGITDSNEVCLKVYMKMSCSYNGDSIWFSTYGRSTCNTIQNATARILPKVNDSCCNCWGNQPFAYTFSNISDGSLTPPFMSLGYYMYAIDTILINGVFTINKNFIFQGNDVELASGAMINILSGDTLVLTGSPVSSAHLHAACNSLWRGIFINPGGCLIVKPQTLIEDADSAIVAINSGSTQGIFQCTGLRNPENLTVFNKNYKAIVVEPCAGTYRGFADTCLFTCRNLKNADFGSYANWQSLPIDTVLPPWSQPYTYMGMDIRSVGAINIAGLDTFDNLQYGIKAKETNLQVYNEEFQNIGFKAGYGIGVDDTGATGSSGGAYTLVADSNSFLNSYNGVIATQSLASVTVNLNLIYDTASTLGGQYGVEVSQMNYFSHTNTLNIEENTITNFVTCIEANMNNYANANINYNFINDTICSPTNWTGIAVNEALSTNALYTIDGNNITVLNNGITENGLYNSHINADTITLGDGISVCSPPNLYTGYGIEATNCNTTQIGCNIITAPSLVYVDTNCYTGIYESQTQNVSIINNSTTLTNNHIQFDGTSTTGNLYFNQMDTGSIGIVCTNNALNGATMGGPSDATDNNFNTFSFAHCRTDIPNVTYYWGILPQCDPNPICVAAVFNSPNSTRSHPCSTPPPPPSLSRRHSMVNHANDSLLNLDSATIEFMKKIVLDRDTFYVLKDTNIVLAKEGVLSILWKNTYLLSDSVLSHFNDSMCNASIGKIIKIDTSMVSSTDTSINYSSLLTTLNNIVPNNNIETNLQIAARGYLLYKINNSLTSNELTILRTLANKCPAYDGSGVYQARALLSLFDAPGTKYSEPCGANQNELHKANERNVSNQTATDTNKAIFNLYPNPNSGSFIMNYQFETGQIGKVILYTDVGEEVGEYALPNSSGTITINNQSLNNGIYIYELLLNNEARKYGMIAIIK